jgi:hypothetical protein
MDFLLIDGRIFRLEPVRMIRLVAPRRSPSGDLCFFEMSRQLGEFPYKIFTISEGRDPVEMITSSLFQRRR